MKYNPDLLNASSKLMYKEAIKRGLKCTLFGDNETILMEKDDKSWYTRGSRTSFQSSVGKTIGDYKPLTKAVLKHFGIPTADFEIVANVDELERINRLRFPLVMKPVDQAHGRGVIVGISSFSKAKSLFDQVLKKMIFEEMLEGTEYRIVCVDYKFLAASFRKPAFVTGDGHHTIKELIDEKNQHPWRGKGHTTPLSYIEISSEDNDYLQAQGYSSFDDIPDEEEEVFIKKTANLSTGGEAHDVTDLVGEENIQLFEKIARVTDLNVIGIDVMCNDLSTPIMSQQNAGIIEVNPSPGLRMHHYPMKGKAVNIAGIILDQLESNIV